MANPFASIVGQRRAQSLLSRTAKQNIALGPWPKGLVDSAAYLGEDGTQLDRVPPDALSAVLNFEINPDGSLEARRGVWEVPSGFAAPNVTGQIVGVFDANFTKYAVFSVPRGAAGPGTTLYLIDPNAPYALGNIKVQVANVTLTSVVKYNNVLYLVSDTTGNALSTGSTPTTTPWVTAAQANIPGGHIALMVRDRMFIANIGTNRLYWSKATDPTTWAAPDGGFVDVSPNDGANIRSVIFDNTNIYIFKSNGIWVFSFVTDPAVDGYLRCISTVSVLDAHFFNGVLYVLTYDGLYVLHGPNLVELSRQVALSSAVDLSSVIGRTGKLLLIPTTFNVYVYDTVLNNWSLWNINAVGWTATPRPFMDGPLHSAEISTSSGISFTILPTARTSALNASYLVLPRERTRQTTTAGSSAFFTLDKLQALPNSGFWHMPEYHFQTRRLRLVPERFIKMYGLLFDWSYVRDNNNILPTSASVRVLRTMKAGEVPTAFYTGLSTGRGQEIKGLGPIFSLLATGIYDAAYSAFASMVRGTSPDVTSHNFRSMSAIIQFLIPGGATDLTNTTLSVAFGGGPYFSGQAAAVPDITIRNAYLISSGAVGEFNDQVAI